MKHSAILFVLLLISSAVMAKHDSDHPLTPDDWKEVMEKVLLLENTGLQPTLLPVIMKNQDTLQLTDEQISAFRDWRKHNYTNVVNIMNRIVERKFQFRIEALTPDTPDSRLYTMQSEIHELQRELLKIKLSCRNLVMTTFTDEQWSNFAFIVADNPKLASLLSHVNYKTATNMQ